MSPHSEQNVSTAPPPGTRRALKVCHVVATVEGARWVAEQLRELRDRHGCEVMAVVGGEQGGLIDLLRTEGIPYYVENFPFDGALGVLRAPLAVLNLARLFRRERVDVVQSHLFFSMVIARLAAWLADVPVRLAMYASPFHLEARTSRWIDRATWWMESALVPSCVSSVELCREMGAPDGRLALVYYGPDERRFDPRDVAPAGVRASFGWPPDTPLIVKVAYFYPRLSKSRWVPAVVHGRGIKGHEDLVRAAPLVLAHYPDAKFLLVGSGWGEHGERYKREVEQLVHEMGLDSSVIFPGYRADANAILREADVAVQSSLHDNPAGTIESLLMECPTVVTRVGGLVDTVREGETGLQANPSDPADLARRIDEMLRDRGRARTLGRAGRKLMLERFTLSRTVDDLHALYRRLRDEETRAFYNPLRSLLRAAVAVPLGAYMAARLLFVDMALFTHLPRLRYAPRGLYRRARRLRAYVRRRREL
ncbi:MAG: glycosyltransferase family 4 protein [Pyrinomonadaceae bacterium]